MTYEPLPTIEKYTIAQTLAESSRKLAGIRKELIEAYGKELEQTCRYITICIRDNEKSLAELNDSIENG